MYVLTYPLHVSRLGPQAVWKVPVKHNLYSWNASTNSKIGSEYIQEIPQSQTADKPAASLGRATQQSRDTRKTNKAEQPALSSPLR